MRPKPQQRALGEAVERRGWHAAVAQGMRPGTFQIRRKISSTPLVSIVICSKTPRLLASCLQAIEHRTAYPVREVVVIEHRNGNAAATGPFDFATMNNKGVQAANGEIIVLMNEDVEALSADLLNELICTCAAPRNRRGGTAVAVSVRRDSTCRDCDRNQGRRGTS